jgi:hypothetical protein
VSAVTEAARTGADPPSRAAELRAPAEEDLLLMKHQRPGARLAAAAAFCIGLALLLVLGSAPASAGKCDRADARLARSGKGDTDGDGISNCREKKLLRTAADDADSDDDGMDDGDEMASGCDPLDSDSDDDGMEDGEDDSPAATPRQKLEALLDAISCPAEAAPGSITALGVTAVLDASTEFEDETCEELAARFAAEGSAFVEIEILEDESGALTALEVEGEDDDHDDDEDDDHGEDEDGEGDDD